MKKNTPLVGVIVFLIIGGVIFWLNKHRSGRENSPVLKVEKSQSAQPVNEPEAHSSDVGDHPRRDSKPFYVLSEQTKNIILTCSQKVKSFQKIISIDDFQTLDGFFNKAREGMPDLSPAQNIIRNLHVREASGRELRLNITPGAGEDALGVNDKIKLFYADQDGFPVAMALPEEFKGQPTAEVVKEFKNRGPVIYVEDNLIRRFDITSSANITERDGHIEELQIYFKESDRGTTAVTGALSCSGNPQAAMECRCL